MGYSLESVCNLSPFEGFHRPSSTQFPVIQTISPKLVEQYAEKSMAIEFDFGLPITYEKIIIVVKYNEKKLSNFVIWLRK
jgi:hypothetical protein